MKLSAALQAVRRLYIDTAPLIYYIEVHPAYIERMDAVMHIMQQTGITGVCSPLTLTEVLLVPLRAGQPAIASQYRDLLLHSREFVCPPLSTAAGEQAADLRVQYGLRTPDALHVAAAITTGCDAVLTNDKTLKRITEIRMLILDELELDPPAANADPA